MWFQDDDIFPFRLTILREIFKGFDSSELPADLAACLQGNKEAITANHAAYSAWKRDDDERRIASHFAHTDSTSHHATPTPPQPPLDYMPARSTTMTAAPLLPHSLPQSATNNHNFLTVQTPRRLIVPTPTLTIPTAPLSSPTAHAEVQQAPPMSNPHTVHRTDASLPLGAGTLPDLASQVCPNPVNTSVRPASMATNWDPQVLFSEFSSQNATISLITPTLNPKTLPSTLPTPHTQRTRRSSQNKNTKNLNSEPALLEREPQSFVDIQLQFVEGMEILNLIGASAMQIPSHLIDPAADMGQTSNANGKQKLDSNKGPNKSRLPSIQRPKQSRPVTTSVTARRPKPFATARPPKPSASRPSLIVSQQAAPGPPNATIPPLSTLQAPFDAPTGPPDAPMGPLHTIDPPDAPMGPLDTHMDPEHNLLGLPPTPTGLLTLQTSTLLPPTEVPADIPNDDDDPYLEDVDYSGDDDIVP